MLNKARLIFGILRYSLHHVATKLGGLPTVVFGRKQKEMVKVRVTTR